MNDSDEFQVQDTGVAVEVTPAAKRLLRVVYIMGVILVLLFLTLIGAIIWKAAHKPATPPVMPPSVLSLGLPQGVDIRAAQVDGDRLVINTGREVIVVDLRKNAIVSRWTATP